MCKRNLKNDFIIFDLVFVLLAATMFFQREDYIVLPFFWLIGTNRIKSHQHTFLILIFTRTRLHCQIPRILVTMNGFETRRVSFIDHIFVPESNTKQH